MSDSPNPPAAVRGAALQFAVGGLIALYFSSAWVVDWPAAADEGAKGFYVAVDSAYKWSLRIAGGLLLGSAIGCGLGHRASLLLGLVAEALFACTAAVMTLDTLLETRTLELTAVILAVLAILSASHARDAWERYRRSASPSSG